MNNEEVIDVEATVTTEPPKKRRGITLIELLVMIGIAGLVTGTVCELVSRSAVDA